MNRRQQSKVSKRQLCGLWRGRLWILGRSMNVINPSPDVTVYFAQRRQAYCLLRAALLAGRQYRQKRDWQGMASYPTLYSWAELMRPYNPRKGWERRWTFRERAEMARAAVQRGEG
jgi:hypothetical protein